MKVFTLIFFSLCSSLLAQTAKHPFTFEDMMKLKRVDEPVPSPDGKWVVFSATDVDLEANTKISHLWIVPANGGESKRLNETANHEERPRFSPDGKKLIWTSQATDPTQIWMCDFDSEARKLVGEPHQVTNISTGADGAIWSPNGKHIVFVSAVYPDCKDDACNKQRDEELKKSKVKAKTFTKLFYRHWNAFTEFNTESAFGTTEELWFPDWEFKGSPWKNREVYRKWSPHLFADKIKTPTLVVHGQNDYRLDVSEGFQLFTTLQRLKIPSKMLYFPDEGHWVLKPQNSRLWYKTVNDWVDQWCGNK